MPSSGGILSFSQTLPFIADKSYIANIVSTSTYKSLTEDIIGSAKFYLSTIDGLNNDDVRLSKRVTFQVANRLRGFKKNKVGPVDGGDHIGGNYATALNLEANLPNLLPESTNIDVGFLDFGNVWGVDYDDTIDESNKIRSATGAAAS